MPAFLLLVGAIIGLFVWAVYWFFGKGAAKQADKLEEGYEFLKYDVLKKVYDIAKKTGKIVGMPVRVLQISEKMNMMPKELRVLYKALEREKLIYTERDSIYLTDFGKDYVEVFMKKKKRG